MNPDHYSTPSDWEYGVMTGDMDDLVPYSRRDGMDEHRRTVASIESLMDSHGLKALVSLRGMQDGLLHAIRGLPIKEARRALDLNVRLDGKLKELESADTLEDELLEACAWRVVPARGGILTRVPGLVDEVAASDAQLRQRLLEQRTYLLTADLSVSDTETVHEEGSLEYELRRRWVLPFTARREHRIGSIPRLALAVLEDSCHVRSRGMTEVATRPTPADLETVKGLYSPLSDGAYTELGDAWAASQAL